MGERHRPLGHGSAIQVGRLRRPESHTAPPSSACGVVERGVLVPLLGAQGRCGPVDGTRCTEPSSTPRPAPREAGLGLGLTHETRQTTTDTTPGRDTTPWAAEAKSQARGSQLGRQVDWEGGSKDSPQQGLALISLPGPSWSTMCFRNDSPAGKTQVGP